MKIFAGGPSGDLPQSGLSHSALAKRKLTAVPRKGNADFSVFFASEYPVIRHRGS